MGNAFSLIFNSAQAKIFSAGEVSGIPGQVNHLQHFTRNRCGSTGHRVNKICSGRRGKSGQFKEQKNTGLIQIITKDAASNPIISESSREIGNYTGLFNYSGFRK
jgi:hypothetical protein